MALNTADGSVVWKKGVTVNQGGNPVVTEGQLIHDEISDSTDTRSGLGLACRVGSIDSSRGLVNWIFLGPDTFYRLNVFIGNKANRSNIETTFYDAR